MTKISIDQLLSCMEALKEAHQKGRAIANFEYMKLDDVWEGVNEVRESISAVIGACRGILPDDSIKEYEKIAEALDKFKEAVLEIRKSFREAYFELNRNLMKAGTAVWGSPVWGLSGKLQSSICYLYAIATKPSD